MNNLINDIQEWSDSTFGSDPKRIYGIASHMIEEANEVRNAVEKLLNSINEDDYNIALLELLKELADTQMLLLDVTSHANFSYEELCNAVKDKLAINKLREWGKPDITGKVNHIGHVE